MVKRYDADNGDIPFGKRLHNYGKIHHVSWENSRTKWCFSIVVLVITRG